MKKTSPGKNHLIYLDPGFLEKMGHFTRMGELLREAAEEDGIALTHHVGTAISDQTAAEHGLTRSYGHRAWLDASANVNEILSDFYKTTERILSEPGLAMHDRNEVFLYTADPLHAPILAHLLNDNAAHVPGLAGHMCLFYINNLFALGKGEQEYAAMLSSVGDLLEDLDPGRRLTLSVDSERIRDAYAPFFKRDIEHLPLPLDVAHSVKKPARNKRRISIGYVGVSMKRTGYDLMYGLYKALETDPIMERVEFRVKHTPHEQLAQVHKQFLKETTGITHLNGFMSTKEYCDFLSQCDILVLPYSRESYPAQTSGIAIEALTRNIPLIAPEDTWMGDQVKKYAAGETFLSGDMQSLILGVKKVANEFDTYRSGLEQRLDRFRAEHSPPALMSELGLRDGREPPPQTRSACPGAFGNVLVMGLEAHHLSWKNGRRLEEKTAEIARMHKSTSWKLTAPLRRAKRWFSAD